MSTQFYKIAKTDDCFKKEQVNKFIKKSHRTSKKVGGNDFLSNVKKNKNVIRIVLGCLLLATIVLIAVAVYYYNNTSNIQNTKKLIKIFDYTRLASSFNQKNEDSKKNLSNLD